MKHSSSCIAVVIIAIVVANRVSSQDTGAGNPTDTNKDIAANSLDTNPPGKADSAVDTTNTAADTAPPSATNVDSAVSVEKTDVPKTSEPVVNGQNGGKDGKGKNGKPKRRRFRPRRKGRKRNGRRKPPKKNGKDNIIVPKEDPNITKPTTTPEMQKQPPDQAHQPTVQDGAQQPDSQAPQGQPQPGEQGPPPDTQGNTQTGPEVQPQPDPAAQAPVDTQTQTDTHAQTQPDAPQAPPGPDPQASPNQGTQSEHANAGGNVQQQAHTTKSKPDTTPPAQAQAQALKQEPNVKAEKSPGKGKDKAAGNANDNAWFQQLFDFDTDQQTTTESSHTAGGPPPSIEFNKKSKKVMPDVDTKGAKAHDGNPCNETYKPHTSKYKYMMRFTEGVWGTLDCPPNLDKGLVWRQDLCSCGEELIAQDPNDWCAQMGFNPHPTNNHKYTRRHHGAQAMMDCAATLVWSQEKCLCMYDPTVKERPIESEVTFVCKKILHLEFEGTLSNSAEAYHVQPVSLKRRGKLPRIRYVKVPGATGKAAMIVSQPLELLAFRGNDFQKHVTYSVNFKLSPRHLRRKNFMVLITYQCLENRGGPKMKKPGIRLWATGKAAMIVSQPLEFLAFRGNDFQKQVTYSVNFKLSPRHLRRKNFMVLITDQCLENRGGPKMKKPGISLRFQPNTRDFHLEFRTEEKVIDEIIKGAEPDRNGWYKTVVYFEDNSLNLENNGKKLYSLTGIVGKIPQNKCPLYIAGRGRGFDRSQDFYGYIDNVQLVKDCTFHEANIKIL